MLKLNFTFENQLTQMAPAATAFEVVAVALADGTFANAVAASRHRAGEGVSSGWFSEASVSPEGWGRWG